MEKEPKQSLEQTAALQAAVAPVLSFGGLAQLH